MKEISRVVVLTIAFFTFVGPITIGILEGALAIGLGGILELLWLLVSAVGMFFILIIVITSPFWIVWGAIKLLQWLFQAA